MPILSERRVPKIIADPRKLEACEVCGKLVPFEEMYSLSICYNMPGPAYPSYHCPNLQHFGCCHDHAAIAVIACLLEHMDDTGLHGVHPEKDTQIAKRPGPVEYEEQLMRDIVELMKSYKRTDESAS